MVWTNAGITHRSTIMGTRGMVATAHPLASLAGLRALMAGGNAVDAAIAASATLNVVEPYMSGLGGGGAMLVHTRSGDTVCLNYGGPVPAAASAGNLDAACVDVGPRAGVVPGIPAGWFAALERFGTMPASDLFAAAIDHAERGVPLTVKNREFFGSGNARVQGAAREVFFSTGATPPAATVVRQPRLAATYRALAEGGPDAFYRGPIGERFVAAVQAAGGLITTEDLAATTVSWSEPSVSHYRGLELRTTSWPLTSYETQLALNILEGFDLASMGHNGAGTIHTMAEAFKLAVADRIAYAGSLEPPPAGLLSAEYAARRRALIDPSAARPVEGDRFSRPRPADAVLPGDPADVTRECTTHLDVADAEGNAVSITQSIGSIFGSGFMAGDTGIMLNNFLYFYDLDPASPNAIRPGMPWGGPLSPVMLFRDGSLFLSIGTPGGFGITQTTAQMISNVVDHGYGVQAAIEAPRFKVVKGCELVMEERVPSEVRAELARRGHDVQVVAPWSAAVGGGQGILIDPETGALSGGADPRRDGYAIGW
ncbi:MAG TPA: gamma-glutamyltransferase family protein [Thermomicrobiaceae bacterium]|nr:gamma-glutamyltransferase family protein [Thermomicrobiaceae bacterium]